MSSVHKSEKHLSFRRKEARISCPGCGKNYNRRYFLLHQRKYLENGVYSCGRPQEDSMPAEHYVAEIPESAFSHLNNFLISSSSDMSADSDCESETDLEEKSKDVNKFRSFYSGDKLLSEISDNNEENWDNVDLEDLNDDLNTNTPRISNESRTSELNSSSFIDILLTWMCIFICLWQASHSIPDCVIGELLHFLKQFFVVCAYKSDIFSRFSMIFPGSLYLLWKSAGLARDSFRKYTVCNKCYSLYSLLDCSVSIEGEICSKNCSFVAYPKHPQKARRANCGVHLMKLTRLLDGQVKLYPKFMYCYKPIQESLQALVLRKDFENECEQWRERPVSNNLLSDIYDGRIWKEFMGDKYSSFLRFSNNFALMLNLDWFQPFDHVSYSVGVLYLVVLNLPRQKRFKRKNVILVGIIPDMGREPNVNSFVEPLVEELKEAWHTGFKLKSYNTGKTESYRLALICVGCDIPATRKLCGFLGHNANLGCSKCMKMFPGSVRDGKDYSGFDRENWPVRQMGDHRTFVKQVCKERTQTDRQRQESRLGVRYSALLELPYFDVIRMSVIDPMHNLFLGTSKRMMHVWLENNIINQSKFIELQHKVDKVMTPGSIGRLPRKIATSFSGSGL